MRKLIPLVLLALPLMLILMVGCGDDETTTITQYDTVTVTLTDTLIEPVPITVKGRVILAPTGIFKIRDPFATGTTDDPTGFAAADLSIDMYGTGPVQPEVDSVLLDDSLCEITHNYYWTYGDPWDYARYWDPTESMRYGSGDTATVEFYAHDMVATARVKLLDLIEDAVVMYEDEIPDTVATGEDITVVWASVPNADWYGVQVQYRHSGTGVTLWHYMYTYSEDTTYTFPGSETQYDGYATVRIASSTGPLRDDAEGNVVGDVVAGTIYSYTDPTAITVYVGTGDPFPPLAKGLPYSSEDTPDDAPVDGWDIIQAITSK